MLAAVAKQREVVFTRGNAAADKTKKKGKASKKELADVLKGVSREGMEEIMKLLIKEQGGN